MNKFGFAAVVASGLAAAVVGVASPIHATAWADALPVLPLPGYSTGIDHHQWIDTIHEPVSVPQVDSTVRQSR